MKNLTIALFGICLCTALYFKPKAEPSRVMYKVAWLIPIGFDKVIHQQKNYKYGIKPKK